MSKKRKYYLIIFLFFCIGFGFFMLFHKEVEVATYRLDLCDLPIDLENDMYYIKENEDKWLIGNKDDLFQEYIELSDKESNPKIKWTEEDIDLLKQLDFTNTMWLSKNAGFHEYHGETYEIITLVALPKSIESSLISYKEANVRNLSKEEVLSQEHKKTVFLSNFIEENKDFGGIREDIRCYVTSVSNFKFVRKTENSGKMKLSLISNTARIDLIDNIDATYFKPILHSRKKETFVTFSFIPKLYDNNELAVKNYINDSFSTEDTFVEKVEIAASSKDPAFVFYPIRVKSLEEIK